MVQTASTMLELGTQAPAFSLPEPASGKSVSNSDFSGQPLLIVFACNHCPYVIHIIEQFSQFAEEYLDKGLHTVMINANDVDNHPDDSPQKMVELAAKYRFTFPYLYDENQQVAKDYRAACTPDLFLFDADHRLVYRGQFDASRPRNNEPVNGQDLRKAADRLLQGKEMPSQQLPSMGCNIKWKAGNEPDYF